MNILALKVQWYPHSGNNPTFQVLADRIPSLSELRFREKRMPYDSGSLFYAELDGYVSFYAWDRDQGNNRGFGGRTFDIILEGEIPVTLLGPWSSRAGAMNAEGCGPCVDVYITNDPNVMLIGHTFLAAATTKAAIEEALPRLLPEVELQEVHEQVDITYIPTFKGMTWEESKHRFRNQTDATQKERG